MIAISAELHKSVCLDDMFYSFTFSPDGKLLAYVAERKEEKAAAFYEDDPSMIFD